MAFFQEKDAPREREKRALPARSKPGARGRGLVSSALASISETAAEDGATCKQVQLYRHANAQCLNQLFWAACHGQPCPRSHDSG